MEKKFLLQEMPPTPPLHPVSLPFSTALQKKTKAKWNKMKTKTKCKVKKIKKWKN